MRILVTGATGLIGCHAVARLVEAGHAVRALVRDASRLGPALAPLGVAEQDVEPVSGDLADPASLAAAAKGCEGLLHCAGLFSPDRDAEARLQAINVEGTRHVLAAGVESGLEQIVHVSSMLALFPPAGPRIGADDPVARPRSMYAATKAAAERVARSFQERAPITIVYPTAVQGPEDPTFSVGPQLVANALVDGRVLVTDGGLAYSDVRDVAETLVAVFAGATRATRLMAPSFFVTHARYRELLEELTGRPLEARRVPGWLLRAMGRVGDLAQRLGRDVQLTWEAADILTRSVPVDDREARRMLGREAITPERSFEDLIRWMVETGRLPTEKAGKLA
ncbi:MAG: SDR family NAD(P)-dependent oxidoreductase [Myxococcota bacterium]|nr:SDR family NAD(P)-dependent oxidoreductase [Myxococcales bacterium]